MAYFKYKSKNIYYQEIGSGTPLLLLHGNTASSIMFTEIAQVYAKCNKVILIDFLGNGKSDRLDVWPEDLWYSQACQVISFLEQKSYLKVNIIGTSGGAITAINAALERPDLVNKIIADSFEGEIANSAITEQLQVGREMSKQNPGARGFYEMMHGTDWEKVIDSDTNAVAAHARNIGNFFHKPITELKPEVLLTGSKEDVFFSQGFYEKMFPQLIQKIGHGDMHIFEHGGHPAMLSNVEEFVKLSKEFFV